MTRPAVGTPAPWCFPEVRPGRLANGLTLRLCHMPGQELASARLVLPGGAGGEPEGAYGAAYIGAVALLRAGLASAAEDLGAGANAEVSWDALALTFTAPAPVLGDALALLARDVAGFPAPATVAAVRRDRLAALARQPAPEQSDAALAATLFAGTRYGYPPGGGAAQLAALSDDAVAAYLRAFAVPALATLVVAADLDALDAYALAECAFGSWDAAGIAPPAPPAPPAPLAGGPIVTGAPGGELAAVTLGCVTPERADPAYAALTVAADCLAGTLRARLNRRLRDRDGVAYAAYGSVEGWRRTGRWTATFTCAAAHADAALAAALDEVADVAGGGLTAEEVAASRGHRVGVLPLHVHTTAALAGAVAESVALGLPADAPARLRADVAACPDDAVRAAAATWLDPRRIAVGVA